LQRSQRQLLFGVEMLLKGHITEAQRDRPQLFGA